MVGNDAIHDEPQWEGGGEVGRYQAPERVDEQTLGMCAAELVAAFRQRGVTVATAESLTAGMVSATMATIPGASAVLRGGLVVYATDLKAQLAQVPPDVLRRFGAVSAQTAEALAQGAAQRCQAKMGIATTGVAGPDRQENKPPGTVFIGIFYMGETHAYRLHCTGNRAAIRAQATYAGIDLATIALAANPVASKDQANQAGNKTTSGDVGCSDA